MKYILIIVVLFFSLPLNSQSVLGYWKTYTKNNQEQALIKIYKEDGLIHARIIKALDPTLSGMICTKCKGKNKDKPIKGMTIIKNLIKKGRKLYSGYALNPLNGKYYKCRVSFKNENILKLRGYIGFSLLGRTEYWYRVRE